MPKVKVSVPHTLDQDEMMVRARPVVEKTVRDFEGENAEYDWSDRSAEFRFTSRGFKISGTLTVDESNAAIEVVLPFAAMMFKNKVEKAVTKNLTRAIEADSGPAAETSG